MFTDDEDDDDQITGLDVNEPSPQTEEYKYDILNANQIVENMVSSIKEVNSVVQLNTTITRILLNHFQWDKERLYERLYDGNRDDLFKEVGILDTSQQHPNQNNPQQHSHQQQLQQNSTLNTITKANVAPSNNKSHETTTTSNSSLMKSIANDVTTHARLQCIICCLDSDQLIGLGCNHAFCNDCWVMYLSTKIMEEGQSGRITCPTFNCNTLIDDRTVLDLVSDRRVKLRYQQLITNSYVECNKQMRWCPKPECGHAVKVMYSEFQPVKCVCNTIFCFLCGDSWHEPVNCDLIRKWKKKCDDDSETSHWIAANTKECPKCRVTIEKNGGCNHMRCKNSDCKAEFCWVCLGAWHLHGSSWYSCNRYDENDGKAARDAQEKSRALLQRYLFYCKRYMNHMASLKFENKLYASVKEKMREMQQHNMSWIEVQFLTRAVDVLCQCRQTLMYTYVFAYYLSKTNQSLIFEDNQKDLESATETLSEYLEREITTDNIKDIKQKVQDKYRYCASRRKLLLEHVQEGNDQDWWVLANY